MIITIVAFNLKLKNSVYYGSMKNMNTATARFKLLLEDSDVDFLSIRKIKEEGD